MSGRPVDGQLEQEDGALRRRKPDGAVDVVAPWTSLATGRYQGSGKRRAQYIHENARGMLLRSNPFSAGDGIRLGSEAGWNVPGVNSGFGCLVSKPRVRGDELYIAMLTQYHSEHALLFNEDGVPFCDESIGDHTNGCQAYSVAMSRARPAPPVHSMQRVRRAGVRGALARI